MRFSTVTVAGLLCLQAAHAFAQDTTPGLADIETAFAREVTPQVVVEPTVQAEYFARMQEALGRAGVALDHEQFVVLVDRNPQVQMVALTMLGGDRPRWLGASRTSTGSTGKFDHYFTPVGVFSNSLDNPSYRAAGTKNEYGIRGYGIKGMRVWDFGWQDSLKGWGRQEPGKIRFQMHATDPDRLEPRLGRPDSKGCVRISASANRFFDRYAVIDAPYLGAAQNGKRPWVIRQDLVATPYAGQHLVVVDSSSPAAPVVASAAATPR